MKKKKSSQRKNPSFSKKGKKISGNKPENYLENKIMDDHGEAIIGERNHKPVLPE